MNQSGRYWSCVTLDPDSDIGSERAIQTAEPAATLCRVFGCQLRGLPMSRAMGKEDVDVIQSDENGSKKDGKRTEIVCVNG